jgi:FixJ family two-component response regulator
MAERNVTVAVVDDDSSFLRALERLLRAAGFVPVTYPSAESFLQESPHPPLDCLILDVRLGTATGFDVARQLTSEGDCPPVIFVTAHDDPETSRQAEQAGCAAYLRKPFASGSLIEAIRRALPGNGRNR